MRIAILRSNQSEGIIPTMNIANIRRLRGLTQTDLAEMASMTQPTVSRAEKSDDGSTLGIYKAIAAALNVSLSELFAENRVRAENELLAAFRQLTPDRQKGWLDMARLAIAERSPTNTESD